MILGANRSVLRINQGRTCWALGARSTNQPTATGTRGSTRASSRAAAPEDLPKFQIRCWEDPNWEKKPKKHYLMIARIFAHSVELQKCNIRVGSAHLNVPFSLRKSCSSWRWIIYMSYIKVAKPSLGVDTPISDITVSEPSAFKRCGRPSRWISQSMPSVWIRVSSRQNPLLTALLLINPLSMALQPIIVTARNYTGCFLKSWYPQTQGLPTKLDHVWWFLSTTILGNTHTEW